MVWNRSNTIALATRKCTTCLGAGLVMSRTGSDTACECVLRSVFLMCYHRFRDCVEKEKYMSKVSLEIHSGPNRRGTWGRKDEEYMADFLQLAQNNLTEEEFKIFRYKFLLGADWRLCQRKFGMDRGLFFYAVYRIEAKLGKAMAELQPYALYPVRDYFQSAPLKQVAKAFPRRDEKVTPIRPPVIKLPRASRRRNDDIRKAA